MPQALIGDRYRLVERIGSGGMGVVWEAWDERLERRVALKQLKLAPGVSDAEAQLATNRALREARISARLHHRSAVPVFDVVEHEGRPCLIMQFVPSVPLSTVLRDGGPLSPREAAQVGGEIAAALAAAHVLGIVHRDVKPGNILITDDGTAMISDFGISHALGDATLTATGMLHGTPAYLSPEVARGAASSAASDVFSFGATLYAAMEGSPPFGSDPNSIALLHRVATGVYAPPTRSGPLEPLITAMLTAEPDARPTMTEVAATLAKVASGPVPPGPVWEESVLTVPRPAAAAATMVDAPGSGPADATTEQPVVVAPARPVAAEPESRPRRRGGPALLLGLLLLVGFGALVVALLTGQLGRQPGVADPAPRTSTAATAAAPSTSTEPQSPAPTRDRESSRSPAPSATRTPSATPTPSARRSPSATPKPSATPTQSATTTRPPTPTPSPTRESTPTSRSDGGTPTSAELAAAIRTYYDQMPNGTDTGWELLTEPYQSGTTGGRRSYQRFWDSIDAVSVRQIRATPPGSAVAVLTYDYANGQVAEERTSFRLVEEDGVLKIDGTNVISSTTR